jgi:hypothetical protein
VAIEPAKVTVEPVEHAIPVVVATDLVMELIMAVNLVIKTTVEVDLAVEPALSSNLVIEHTWLPSSPYNLLVVYL